MAEYTYDQLRKMTVAKLREIADGHPDESLQGHSTMHKDKLLPILCKVLGIPTHHIAHGAEKTRLKGEIRKLKAAAMTETDRQNALIEVAGEKLEREMSKASLERDKYARHVKERAQMGQKKGAGPGG